MVSFGKRGSGVRFEVAGTSVGMLKLDPIWSRLWKLPRFQKLVEKHA